LEQKQESSSLEPNRAVIHIYVEVSQGNFLCSYLKQAKLSFFFLFYKFREQEGTGRWIRSCLGELESVGEGRRWKRVSEGEDDTNTVYTGM
jgi:hypothetical protein